jgi:hypothetical protein
MTLVINMAMTESTIAMSLTKISVSNRPRVDLMDVTLNHVK